MLIDARQIIVLVQNMTLLETAGEKRVEGGVQGGGALSILTFSPIFSSTINHVSKGRFRIYVCVVVGVFLAVRPTPLITLVSFRLTHTPCCFVSFETLPQNGIT